MMRRAFGPAGLGAALLGVACVVPNGIYTAEQVGDVKLFQRFGERILGGEIPYRDFFVEYPPGALPAFVLPALGAADDYTLRFKALQIVFGVAAIGFLCVALAALGASRPRMYGAAAFAGLAPLALGPVVLNRYDLWPTALTLGAVAALAAGRSRLALGVLAAAVAAKGFAIVLVPVALLHIARREGKAAARRAAGVFAVVGALIVAPFLALGPGGVRFSIVEQLSRGLHLESLAASVLAALHRVGLYEATVASGYGKELVGSGADLLALASSVATVAAVLAGAVVYRRGPANGERMVVACVAAVVAFVALGKILSPQFLIWLVPLVPLVAGRAGLACAATLLATCALTRAFFPARYADVVALGDSVWIVLARNLTLVALLVLLLATLRARAPRDARSP